MLERKKPIFTKGRILKNEMLESLRDFPRQVTDVFLVNYSDGIIAGLCLFVDQTNITVTPGIVKYQDEILILGDELKIPYVANGDEQILKLQFQDRYKTNDFEGRRVNVVLENGDCNQQNEMEMARFKLSQGAYLRSDYQDFEDFKTGHNTLNIVNQPYSSISGQALNPAILTYFARELMKYKTENTQDSALIYQVLNQNISMSKELLVYYVKSRLQENSANIESNEDLHTGLSQILKKAKLEQRGIGRTISGNRRLIVD